MLYLCATPIGNLNDLTPRMREALEAADLIAACREAGVLVLKAKNKVRLLPALNISWDLLKEAAGILKDCICE